LRSSDCDEEHSIKGEGTATLNPDGSASAELTQTAIVLSSTVHFRGRLGAQPAPGGTSQMRVSGRSGLRMIWNLPNNQLVVNVRVSGQSCSAQFQPILKPGKTQYTLFDGRTYHYCGRPRAERSSCEVR